MKIVSLKTSFLAHWRRIEATISSSMFISSKKYFALYYDECVVIFLLIILEKWSAKLLSS
jgi:hypothetical protein